MCWKWFGVWFGVVWQLGTVLSGRKRDFGARVHGGLESLLATLPLVREMLNVQPWAVIAEIVLNVMVALREKITSKVTSPIAPYWLVFVTCVALDLSTRVQQLRVLADIDAYIGKDAPDRAVSRKARGAAAVSNHADRIERLLNALYAAKPDVQLDKMMSRDARDRLLLVTLADVDAARAAAQQHANGAGALAAAMNAPVVAAEVAAAN
jgi:hypothetical protein